MKPGGQFGHEHVRLRQYISVFILALFLCLFVGAMAKASDAVARPAVDHVVLSFDQPVSYTPKADAYNGTLSITFPGMSVMALQQEHLQKFTPNEQGAVKDVRVEGDDAQGARLVVTLRNPENKRVRLLRFSAPHQLMIHVADKYDGYDNRAVHYTSASLYKA